MKLKKKISMYYIFACIVPVAIMLVILLNQNAVNIRDINKNDIEKTVVLVNKIAKQELEKGFISLDYLKSVSGQEGQSQIENALYDISRNSPNFVRVYIVDSASNSIDSYPKDGRINRDVMQSEWYKKAKSKKKLVYSQPKTEDSYIVTVSKSFMKSGVNSGAVVVAVDIDLKLAFAELQRNQTKSISNYTILDRDSGNILFPSTEEMSKEFVDDLIANDANLGKIDEYKTKDKGLVSYYKELVEGTEWVLVGTFTQSALKVTYNVSKNILYVSLAIIIFLSFFSVVVFDSMMVNPLVQVKEKFKQASTGNYGTRIFVDSNDEIGDLATEFNSLMKKISRKVKAIEGGVNLGLTKSQIAADIELEEATSIFNDGMGFETSVPKYDFNASNIYNRKEIEPKPKEKIAKDIFNTDVLLENNGFDDPVVEEDEEFKQHERDLIHRTFDEWRMEYFKTLEEKKKG